MCANVDIFFLRVLYVDQSEWKSPDTAGTPPSPRQGHVVAVVGGVLYIHGGMAGQNFLDDLQCLDLGKEYTGNTMIIRKILKSWDQYYTKISLNC